VRAQLLVGEPGHLRTTVSPCQSRKPVSARTLPGFSDEPDCFQITLYTLDKDEWTEGFSIVE
jgi:hypothetical protein